MKEQWLEKAHMWVVGFRRLDNCSQDTNVVIERYHGFAKSILKSERSRMTGQRVDWCITALTEDVLDHYWYKDLRKEKGFVDNKKMHDTVVGSILKARKIPDIDVTLPDKDGDTALVTSTKHQHLRYAVHNPGSEWGVCNYVWAQRGNICKHHVKVVMMMHPDIAEWTIARYCGRMAGNVNGGLKQLLTPWRIPINWMEDYGTPISQSSSVPVTPNHTPQRRYAPDVADALQMQVIQLHEEVGEDQFLMEHLLAEFNQTLGRLRRLKADRRAGIHNPLKEAAVFETVNDGIGFKLARNKDFLEHSGPLVAR